MGRPIAHKVVLLFGHATFIALLALAWKHADLRTTSGDSAYQIFKWVNDPGLNIEAHRYSAIFPQLAVKVFKFFHADLETLLLVASVAHVLVAYVIFLACLLLLHAPRSAMAVALAAVLCTRLTFYGPVLEANYLLCYPFLFFAVLERNGHTAIGGRASAGLLVAGSLTLLVHPLGWLVLLFGLVFLWSVHRITHRSALSVSAGLVLGAVVVRLLFPPTAYEQEQYAHLGKVLSMQDLGGAWASWDFLAGHTFHLTTNYLPALLVFILVGVAFVLRKHGLAAAVLAVGVIGFLTMVLVTFRAGDTAIMMDRAFLPVASLIALPAIHLLWELRERWTIVGGTLLVLVLFIKLRDVSFGSRFPAKQLARMEQLVGDVRAHDLNRAEVSRGELEARGIDGQWALPFSTLLISSMQGPGRTLTIRMPQAEASTGEASGMTIAAPQLHLAEIRLNPGYFRLQAGPFVPCCTPSTGD